MRPLVCLPNATTGSFYYYDRLIWAGGASNGARARVWRQVQINPEEKATTTIVLAGPPCAYLRSGKLYQAIMNVSRTWALWRSVNIYIFLTRFFRFISNLVFFRPKSPSNPSENENAVVPAAWKAPSQRRDRLAARSARRCAIL